MQSGEEPEYFPRAPRSVGQGSSSFVRMTMRFFLMALGSAAAAASVASAARAQYVGVPRLGLSPAVMTARATAPADRRAAEIEGLQDQVEQLRYDGLDIHLTVVREIEAEISRLQLDDALESLETSAAAWRRTSLVGALDVAASLLAVLAACRTCVLLHAASFYASKGASFASQLTEALRILPGERIAPMVGRLVGRVVVGREYSPWTRGKGSSKGKSLGSGFVRR